MDGFAPAVAANIRTRKLDVLDESAVKDVIADIVDTEGRIDIVVNNAGAPCHGTSAY